MDLALLSRWTWDPSIVLGLVALAATPYLVRDRALSRRAFLRPFDSSVWWWLGLLALAIALVSPLDYLADHVFFFAHMLQHLLLLLVIPPLLLIGWPAEGFLRVRRGIDRLGLTARLLCQPFVAFLLSTLVVWTWHVPTFYEAALASEPLHAIEHLSFIGTALLYWWPIVQPSAHPSPIADLFQLPYLLAAVITSSLLAAVITFASTVLYPTYATSEFATVRAALGLSPLVDQQIGGLLMWVGGGLWYVLAAGGVLIRWFNRPDPDDDSQLDHRAARGIAR